MSYMWYPSIITTAPDTHLRKAAPGNGFRGAKLKADSRVRQSQRRRIASWPQAAMAGEGTSPAFTPQQMPVCLVADHACQLLQEPRRVRSGVDASDSRHFRVVRDHCSSL
ncbi:hypothetical protein CEXT_503191 [Caerostris extrusa]|uniref:Uncharacterized protein n=1 Tax=Caerostris extrusa TaxID=172846 RepID=A0AAV4NY99_CAEEX|nr:hypothetical protein CEXT_503191 [Caerostris extrusa]